MISRCNAEAVDGRSKMRYKRAPVDPAPEFFHLLVLHMPQASCEHFTKLNLKFTWAFTQPETNLTTCLFMQDGLNTLMWWFDNSRQSLSARVRYLGGARTCPTGDNLRLGERPIKTQLLPTTPRRFSFLKGGRKTHLSVMAREYIKKKARRRGVFSVLLRSDKFYQV